MPPLSLKAALIAALFLYSIPLWRLRYRWRAAVYRMPHWKVNILPWFGHDFLALFTNRYFHTAEERRMATRFRWYVLGYAALAAAALSLP